MSQDHYVPQTYLERFIDPNKPGHVRLYSKSKQFCVPATPEKICREFDGDSNFCFSNPRVLDSILHEIEPKWNWALDELERGNITGDMLLIIATNIARFRSCTPTRKRLAKSMLENDLESLRPYMAEWVKRTSEQHEDLEELINGLLDSNIKLSVDQDLGHAFAIQNVVKVGLAYTISDWCILRNDTLIPFITSDNPGILINLPSHLPSPIYVPLTPKHAILIFVNPKNPDIHSLLELLEKKDIGVSELNENLTKFSKNRSIQNLKATDITVEMVNHEIVKFAEDKIIANVEAEWIKKMVKEYKNWEVQSLCKKVLDGEKEAIFQYTEQVVLNDNLTVI